jgi:hypothetical protein
MGRNLCADSNRVLIPHCVRAWGPGKFRALPLALDDRADFCELPDAITSEYMNC